MMIRRLLLILGVFAGCTKADAEQGPAKAPVAGRAGVVGNFAKPPAPVPARPVPLLRVELTAVTLADDCGGSAPHTAPAIKAKSATWAKDDAAGARARRCEQTSMQLAITADAGARIKIKSVELFDDAGASLGKLTASKPTRWSVDSAIYESWDEVVPAGAQINVSYVLQRPAWEAIGNRWNRTFTLRTVVTIGGVDRTAQKQVTLSAPATLPPNVKT
jgi:hypothetical protein